MICMMKLMKGKQAGPYIEYYTTKIIVRFLKMCKETFSEKILILLIETI